MTAGSGWRSAAHPRVPTLTEVIHVPDDPAPAAEPAAPAEPAPPAEPAAAVPASWQPPTDSPGALETAGAATAAFETAASPPSALQTAALAPVRAQTPASPIPPPGLDIDEQALTQKVLHEVQQRIDLMFEYRLREALAPSLARLAEAVLRETRVELATTLRDVVARAVAQELSRHRQR